MSGVCITPFTLAEAFRFDLFTHCSDILWKTKEYLNKLYKNVFPYRLYFISVTGRR